MVAAGGPSQVDRGYPVRVTLASGQMSFRGRLRVFFTIIVIVPMVAVAAVLYRLTADSETGKADAGIAAGMRIAFSLYDASAEQAEPALRRLAANRASWTGWRPVAPGPARPCAASRPARASPGSPSSRAASGQVTRGGQPGRHRRRGRSAGRRAGPSAGHAEPLGHGCPRLRRPAATAHRPPGRGQPRRTPAGRHRRRRPDGPAGRRRLRAPAARSYRGRAARLREVVGPPVVGLGLRPAPTS